MLSKPPQGLSFFCRHASALQAAGFCAILQSANVPVAQLDRASASGAEGRRFESCQARQKAPLRRLSRRCFFHRGLCPLLAAVCAALLCKRACHPHSGLQKMAFALLQIESAQRCARRLLFAARQKQPPVRPCLLRFSDAMTIAEMLFS